MNAIVMQLSASMIRQGGKQISLITPEMANTPDDGAKDYIASSTYVASFNTIGVILDGGR